MEWQCDGWKEPLTWGETSWFCCFKMLWQPFSLLDPQIYQVIEERGDLGIALEIEEFELYPGSIHYFSMQPWLKDSHSVHFSALSVKCLSTEAVGHESLCVKPLTYSLPRSLLSGVWRTSDIIDSFLFQGVQEKQNKRSMQISICPEQKTTFK